MTLQKRSTKLFEKATMDFYNCSDDDVCLCHGTFQPGWRWSTHIKPDAKTDLCTYKHTGYCKAGAMSFIDSTGRNFTVTEGDFFEVEPGHDAWVSSSGQCEMIDFKKHT